MDSIGAELKQAREARKLTTKKAAQLTHLRQHYIEALEADDLASMPSPVQARGFLRLYADFLGLNSEELIARQRAESNPGQVPPAAAQPTALPPASPAESQLPLEPPPAPEPEPEPVIEAYIELAAPPAPPRPSYQIFAEIGQQIRTRRELISLTINEIERHTHIRKHYIIAIENGEFDNLPSPVQARGMLSTYASFLDMNTEAILLRYAEALQVRRAENQPETAPKPAPKPSILPAWLRNFISPDLIFGGSMILLLLGLGIWGGVRIISGEEVPVTATQGPSISDVILATPVVTQASAVELTAVGQIQTTSPDAAETTETPTPAFTGDTIRITVLVGERTYLRVTVDGEVKQDGRVIPGAALVFEGAERIEVLTGNGAAVQIRADDVDLGLMGSFGEVANLIYTLDGIQTPTPTATPMPTNTPRFRPTETPFPPTPTIDFSLTEIPAP
jgi:cytoskeletal protein RodZ